MSEALAEKPRRKTLKRVLIILAILILTLIIGVGIYLWSIGHTWDSKTQKFDSITNSQGDLDSLRKNLGDPNNDPNIVGPDGKTADSLANDLDKNGNGILDSLEGGKTRQVVKGEGTNILLLGSDQRSGQEAATVSGARADTIMLMHIPKNGEGVYLVSIMRDSWVSIPGYGNAKVNAALNYGGISLQIETIEQLIGVKIDHVAEIDFDGFKGLTNALGGVDVQVPFAFQTGVWNFTPGTMHMDGSTALAFVRERYSFASGDYQRVRNQRAYLRGLYTTIQKQGFLGNITNFKNMVDAFSGYVKVDSGLGSGEILRIAAPVINGGSAALHMTALPNAGPGWSYDGQSIIIINQPAVDSLTEALKADRMQDFMNTYGSD